MPRLDEEQPVSRTSFGLLSDLAFSQIAHKFIRLRYLAHKRLQCRGVKPTACTVFLRDTSSKASGGSRASHMPCSRDQCNQAFPRSKLMTGAIGSNWGDATPLNPSLGYVGGHLNFGNVELSFSIDQSGELSGGVSWNFGAGIFVGSGESFGWSTPTPFVQLGQTYTPSGTHGTFAIGHPVAGFIFGVHESNPTTGMEAAEERFANLDSEGAVTGYTLREHLPHPEHGWLYRITTLDLNLNPVGVPIVMPMPVQDQLLHSSGVISRCFPGATAIGISPNRNAPHLRHPRRRHGSGLRPRC